jgi:hypothetical protein
MDFRPKHLLAMAALAGGLAFGGATLASAQTSDDGTTDTTVADDSTTNDDAVADGGTTADEDCPLRDGTATAAPTEDDATASSTSA